MLLTIENLFSAEQIAIIQSKLNDAEWLDGKTSAGAQAKSVKANQQLNEDSELYHQLSQAVIKALSNKPNFVSASLANKIFPPKFNRYTAGGHYGEHIDSAILELGDGERMRSDLAATLFFDEPGSYQGGELCINSPFGVKTAKLKAGDMVLYPANTLHEVKPVTSGQRRCAFFWIESLVRDTTQRSQLFALDQTIQSLTLQLSENSAEIKNLTTLYHNLLRAWSTT